MKYDFDIVIIGGGAGGLFAASAANVLGAKTCMIEKKKLGGDCTWFGCMPSKALLKSAQTANLFKRYSEFGLNAQGSFSIDTSKVMSHVRDVVEEIATHHPAEVFEKRGIKVIFGPAQFVDKDTIEIHPHTKSFGVGVNGKRLTSKKFIICTGSHPLIPPIEGVSRNSGIPPEAGKDIEYLTNENVFGLNKFPQSLIVLGGGPIGVELSQALNRLGVKIYIVEMMERILFREDKEAAQVLETKLKEEGIQILTGKKAVKFDKKGGLVHVTLEGKDRNQEQISAENVLVAVGRAPNLEGLSLERAGVEFTRQGIKVNPYLETTNKNIFACGDVVGSYPQDRPSYPLKEGSYMFSHVASYQAQVCVRNALFKRPTWQKVSYQNIAWTTFTEPELSHLGQTEEEAREKCKDIKIYKTEYTSSDRAITDLEKQGLVKVITDKKGNILGAHIVGAQASEIIQGFLIAKSLKIPLLKLAPILFIYPTLSELVKKTSAKPLLEKMNNPVIKFVMNIMKRN